MNGIKVVTDSAADLPASLAQARGIEIVPLTVCFGAETYTAGVDLTSEAFWEKLRTTDAHPTTAAPAPARFEEVYRHLTDEGARGIVSVHMSSKLSATCDAARAAADALPDVPVEVVDTLGVSAVTGLLALRAADLADRGLSPTEIARDLTETRSRTHLYGVIDTLEYLRRGGRIGAARSLVGTALKVKPLITLSGGEVAPAGRVRTRARALEHLAGRALEHAGKIERLVFVSGDASDVDALRDLAGEVADVGGPDVWTLGPVVGAHAGPGVVGLVFITTP